MGDTRRPIKPLPTRKYRPGYYEEERITMKLNEVIARAGDQT